MNPPDDHAGCPTSSSDGVKSFRRFGAANPDLNPAYPCLGRPTSPRRRGSPSTRAGKYVYRCGLVPHDHINPVESRERAEEIEMHLANYLRRHGYGVWSN